MEGQCQRPWRGPRRTEPYILSTSVHGTSPIWCPQCRTPLRSVAGACSHIAPSLWRTEPVNDVEALADCVASLQAFSRLHARGRWRAVEPAHQPTTLSLPVGQTNHAPTTFRGRCFCHAIGVRVGCAYSTLLPLLMRRCRSLTALLPELLSSPLRANSLRLNFLLIRAEHFSTSYLLVANWLHLRFSIPSRLHRQL